MSKAMRSLEVKKNSLNQRVKNLAEEEGKWITVNGRHVLIKEGESLGSALTRSGIKDNRKGDRAPTPKKGASSAEAEKGWESAAQGQKNFWKHNPDLVMKAQRAWPADKRRTWARIKRSWDTSLQRLNEAKRRENNPS